MDNLGILIQAILSLKDTTVSKNQIAKDLPKLENQLQSDKNTRVKIIAGLNIAKSKSLIQSQLNTITNQAKAPTIKVGLEVVKNNSSVQNITNGLKQVQAQAITTGSSFDKLNKQLQTLSFPAVIKTVGKGDNEQSFTDTFKSIEKARAMFKSLGFEKVSFKWVDDGGSTFDKLIAKVTDSKNVIQELKFTLEGDNFKYSGLTGADDGVQKLIESTQKAQDKLKALRTNLASTLKGIGRSYSDPSASKAITDSKHIKSLNAQYVHTLRTIAQLKNADDTTMASMKANANKEIATLKQMVKEFRNAEYAADALRTKDIGTVKNLQIQELDKFINKVNGSKVPLDNMTADVNELRTALANIGDKDSLTRFLNQFDTAKAKFESFKTLYQSIGGYQKQIETAISSLNRLNDSTVFRNNSSNPQVTQTKQEIASLITEYQKLYVQLQANPTSQGLETLRTKLTELDNRMKTATDSAKAFQNQLRSDNSTDQMRKKVELLTRQMKAYQATNTKAAKAYKQQFSDMFAILSNPNIDNQAFTTVQKQFQALQKEAIATGKAGKTMFQTIGDAVKKFAGWMSMTYLVSSFARSLRDMVNNVIELDTAMTNLKKVTDETEATYSKFLKNTSKQAKELHSTIIDLVEQVATWSKLGYSLSQAEHLAKVSMIYSKVGEVDNTTSVSDLVTVMKAFNIESEKSIHIVDSLNQLGNTFATDAKSLGEGLTKSSSALNAANNSFEQSIALLTGGTEITQNASEMGNALKTISMRIRGMKGELEELGEEYENVESISKIQTQILNLTGGHTNIFDDNGNFKSTYDILKSISEVYDNLTDPDRAELTEILFGKMRGNQGIALIQAFQSGQIEKAYESALNSAGSAQKEFDAWSKSIEAHINTFKASWESLSQTVMESDFLKGIVDLGTTIISTLDSIIDKFGTIPTLLTSIATVGAFKNVGEIKHARLCTVAFIMCIECNTFQNKTLKLLGNP